MGNETNPQQLELPLGEPPLTKSEMLDMIHAQQREIASLRHKLDEVYTLVHRVWGMR